MSLRGVVVIPVSDSAQLMTVNQIFYDSQHTQPHRARITNLVCSSSTTFTIGLQISKSLGTSDQTVTYCYHISFEIIDNKG